ncbi:hypothetical protein FRC10_007407 [Ceratobasidium sp. 414]|nr:hypothetical protein FRC10_007407 [Ceratobasidium sp. 414]
MWACMLLQLARIHAINRPEIVQKAFRLCAVPDTELNLSYESLTNREAKQAILSLGVSSPTVYAEIMAGPHPDSAEELAGAESGPFAESTDLELEDDTDHTVEEVSALVLAASSAVEAGRPLAQVSNSDDELESDEDQEVAQPLPAAVTPTTRSGRAPRLSSRYCGNDWVCH